MATVALVTITWRRNQSRCPSTDEQTMKLWSMTNNHSTRKLNKVMNFAGKRMGPLKNYIGWDHLAPRITSLPILLFDFQKSLQFQNMFQKFLKVWQPLPLADLQCEPQLEVSTGREIFPWTCSSPPWEPPSSAQPPFLAMAGFLSSRAWPILWIGLVSACWWATAGMLQM